MRKKGVLKNDRNEQYKETVYYFSARGLWSDLSDGSPDMVWDHGISGSECVWKCADVLSGGGRDVSLSADEMGRQYAAQMVLSVLSAYHIADDIDFGISDCDAGSEHGLEWDGDFYVGYPFPVCGDWRKHSLLDYFVDCKKKKKSGLWTRMEAFKNVSALHSSFLCALFWPGGHFLCGQRSDEPDV